ASSQVLYVDNLGMLHVNPTINATYASQFTVLANGNGGLYLGMGANSGTGLYINMGSGAGIGLLINQVGVGIAFKVNATTVTTMYNTLDDSNGNSTYVSHNNSSNAFNLKNSSSVTYFTGNASTNAINTKYNTLDDG